MSLEEEILELVRTKRNVTFAELQQRHPNEKGIFVLAPSSDPNCVFWAGMSERLSRRSTRSATPTASTSPPRPRSYLIDGLVLS